MSVTVSTAPPDLTSPTQDCIRGSLSDAASILAIPKLSTAPSPNVKFFGTSCQGQRRNKSDIELLPQGYPRLPQEALITPLNLWTSLWITPCRTSAGRHNCCALVDLPKIWAAPICPDFLTFAVYCLTPWPATSRSCHSAADTLTALEWLCISCEQRELERLIEDSRRCDLVKVATDACRQPFPTQPQPSREIASPIFSRHCPVCSS